MTASKVRLPPPIVNGEPKTLHTMNSKELRSLLRGSLLASMGLSYHHNFYNANGPRPPWWPNRLDKFQELQMHSRYSTAHIKDLLRLLYKYHNQEDTLNLFESKNGELSWYLTSVDSKVQNQGTTEGLESKTVGRVYRLHSKRSGKEVCYFNSEHMIVPLLALSATQRELNGGGDSSVSTRRRHKIGKAEAEVFSRRRVCRTPERQHTPLRNHATTTPSVKRPVVRRHASILGNLEYHCQFEQEVTRPKRDWMVKVAADPFVCCRCKDRFRSVKAFQLHCSICSSSTRKKAQQSHFLARNLNLITRVSADECDAEVTRRAIQPKSVSCQVVLPTKVIAREALTSELGRILGSQVSASRSLCTPSYDQFCNQSQHTRRRSVSSFQKPYPACYKAIPGLNDNTITWKYSSSERRTWMAKMATLSKQKRKCKKLNIVVRKWSAEEVTQYKQRVNNKMDFNAQKLLGIASPRRLKVSLRRLDQSNVKQFMRRENSRMDFEVQRRLGIDKPNRLTVRLRNVARPNSRNPEKSHSCAPLVISETRLHSGNGTTSRIIDGQIGIATGSPHDTNTSRLFTIPLCRARLFD